MEIFAQNNPFDLTNDFRLRRCSYALRSCFRNPAALSPNLPRLSRRSRARRVHFLGPLFSDASILAHLDRENPINPRALAAHLSVAASTLSAALARLSGLGYLASKPSPSDKRQRELRLTARGAEAIASTSVLDEKRVRQLLDRLNPKDRAAALRGLQLLAQAARIMKQPI